MVRILSFFALFMALVSTPAFACRFELRTLDENLKTAKTAFIGVMRTDEVGLAIFNVEKALAGVKAGDEFSVEMGDSSCHFRFTPGQIWLYLGEVYPAGSLLLMDEYGRVQEDNAKIIKDKFGYDVTQSPSVIKGSIQDTCAPWDGAAFRVTLDNGVTAAVYTRFRGIKEGPDTYSIGNDPEHMGGGVISICGSDAKDCKQYTGRLIFGAADAESASGQVEVDDGEHKSTYIFRVKRNHTLQVCG